MDKPLQTTNRLRPSSLDNKAFQCLKLNPSFDIQRMFPKGIKNNYSRLSRSTYHDSFDNEVQYPSMADYELIAENIAHVYEPDFTLEREMQPYENEKVDLRGAVTKLLNLDSAKVDRNKQSIAIKLVEEIEASSCQNNQMYGQTKTSDLCSPPKITDLGNIFYRSDISTDCLPRKHHSLFGDQYKIRMSVRKALDPEYSWKIPQMSDGSPKRYTNFTIT